MWNAFNALESLLFSYRLQFDCDLLYKYLSLCFFVFFPWEDLAKAIILWNTCIERILGCFCIYCRENTLQSEQFSSWRACRCTSRWHRHHVWGWRGLLAGIQDYTRSGRNTVITRNQILLHLLQMRSVFNYDKMLLLAASKANCIVCFPITKLA